MPPAAFRLASKPCLQAAAEGIVGRDEVPFLAVVLEQERGHRIGFHARRVADAEHVPMALRAGDRIGVTAGNDMEHLLLEADIGHRLRQRRIDVAEQEVDLVALDQLVGFLHRDGGFAAGRIFDQQIDFAAEDTALGIDLLDRELAADQFVLADRGEGAGQRVVEADLDWLIPARRDHERRSELRNTC